MRGCTSAAVNTAFKQPFPHPSLIQLTAYVHSHVESCQDAGLATGLLSHTQQPWTYIAPSAGAALQHGAVPVGLWMGKGLGSCDKALRPDDTNHMDRAARHTDRHTDKIEYSHFIFY